jgi:hypothetical protein
MGMDSASKDLVEEEIIRLKQEVKVLAEKAQKVQPVEKLPEETVNSMLIRLLEERERTNKALSGLMDKIITLEQQFHEAFEMPAAAEVQMPQQQNLVEVPVSNLDGMILDFVRTKGMACADDIKGFMKYRGRNAACNRLSKLCASGFLIKSQLGHRVYYRIDAGKATKALIISPPQ